MLCRDAQGRFQETTCVSIFCKIRLLQTLNIYDFVKCTFNKLGYGVKPIRSLIILLIYFYNIIKICNLNQLYLMVFSTNNYNKYL